MCLAFVIFIIIRRRRRYISRIAIYNVVEEVLPRIVVVVVIFIQSIYFALCDSIWFESFSCSLFFFSSVFWSTITIFKSTQSHLEWKQYKIHTLTHTYRERIRESKRCVRNFCEALRIVIETTA